MARPRKSIPSVAHHKSTGQARVRIAGKDIYLGRYGSPEARAAFSQLLGEIQTSGQEAVRAARELIDDPTGPTVSALCLAFFDHAEATYRKNGRLTSTISTFKTPIRVLRTLYGNTPARNFGPIALEAVRQAFVGEGVSREVANTYTGNVRRIFQWGVSRQIVPVAVVQALACLAPLRAGRTTAPERDPVPPVADATIDATLPYLPTVVQAMIRLQRLTGMRPGEVCSIRPGDVERLPEVWIYQPAEHKTMHKDRSRAVHLGPKAQAVLSPYLLRAATAFCFSPAEAAQEVRDRRHEERRTPEGRGNEIGTHRKRKPVRSPRASAHNWASQGV